MKKQLALLGVITSIAAAWIGAALGIWGAYQGRQDTQFNHAVKLKEQTTASFESEAEILEKEKNSKALKDLNSKHKEYEQAWRGEQELLQIIQPMLNYKITKPPSKHVTKIKSILAELEGNTQFYPTPIVLGVAYFVIEEDEKAREYLKYAKESGYDPPASVFLAAVYSRLSKKSPDEKSRQQLERAALFNFKQAVNVSAENKPNKSWLNSSGNYFVNNQATGLVAFAFDNKELFEIVNGDPDSKKLIYKLLKGNANEKEQIWAKEENSDFKN